MLVVVENTSMVSFSEFLMNSCLNSWKESVETLFPYNDQQKESFLEFLRRGK